MDIRMREVIGTGNCVIDLCCGSGELLRALADQFDQRIGLDVSKRRMSIVGGRSEVWVFQEADLNFPFPLPDEIADAVIGNQVIEHIIVPVHFAKEIHRVLKSGGRCVITTPNIRYLKNVSRLLFSGYGPRTAGGNTLDGNWDDGHLHYFTHRDLRGIFSQLGFREVHSLALIGLEKNTWFRHLMDRGSGTWLVREFLSGSILLWAVK